MDANYIDVTSAGKQVWLSATTREDAGAPVSPKRRSNLDLTRGVSDPGRGGGTPMSCVSLAAYWGVAVLLRGGVVTLSGGCFLRRVNSRWDCTGKGCHSGSLAALSGL